MTRSAKTPPLRIGHLSADLERAIDRQVLLALSEDLGKGDLAAIILPPDAPITARVLCREDAVLAGVFWFEAALRHLDSDVRFTWHKRDGDALAAGDVVCEVRGQTSSLLTGERSALNFLQTLSGTATRTARFAAAVRPHQVRLRDTRKTLPCLRLAQKYAVLCGGGENHRLGLFDAILIKENYMAARGAPEVVIRAVRSSYPEEPIEIEVENLKELDLALGCLPDMILLDNFTIKDLRRAVTMTQGAVPLEASGNITLDNAAEIAATGVDYIAVGSLTKDVQAVDFSMRVVL